MKNFRMIHHVDQGTIDEMYGRYRPVFVLTSGRSGSKLVAELLNLAPEIHAQHEPRPTLQYFSDFACRRQAEAGLLESLIDAARMEMVLEAMIRGKTYVESNQCLAFFAPALARRFAGARFVHLLRHPGDFVASAVRKGWHRNDSIWEAGRVRLHDEARWASMDQVQRLAWLWDFTHRALGDFLAGLEEERGLTCRLEDLVGNVDHARALFAFCGAVLPDAHAVRGMLGRRVNTLRLDADEPENMKKDPHFPSFPDWPAADREKVRRACAETAARFGYEL